MSNNCVPNKLLIPHHRLCYVTKQRLFLLTLFYFQDVQKPEQVKVSSISQNRGKRFFFNHLVTPQIYLETKPHWSTFVSRYISININTV